MTSSTQAVRRALASVLLLAPLAFGTTCALAQGAIDLLQKREHVARVLNAAPIREAKIDIATMWAMDARVPRDLADLEAFREAPVAPLADDLAIESLQVEDGTIVVTLGTRAPSGLAGTVLAWAPCVSKDDVTIRLWVCGQARCPAGHGAPSGPAPHALNTLPPEALPSMCR